MPTVTVALVGTRSALRGEFPPDGEWKKTWVEREHATVTASAELTYGEIVSRGLVELGFGSSGDPGYQPYSIAFWRAEDDELGVGRASMVLAVPRADGSADWLRWADVTVEQATRARSAGLFSGDPYRAYAFVLPQVGNGTLPTWHEFAHMLDVLRQVAELLTLPGGMAATYFLLRGSPDRALEAIEQHDTDWATRGLDPYVLDQWLDDHPWHPADLAAALACTEQEAAAVLWALGFAQSSSGLWRRAIDAESKTLDRVRSLLISTASRFANDPRLAEELRLRLQHLIDTGEPPLSRNWDSLPWLEPKMPGTAAMQARSKSGFAAILRRLRKSPD